MDESSVKFFPPPRAGAIATERFAGRTQLPEQRASLRARRSALSYICFVCDDAEVQPLLPQIFVVNNRLVPPAVAVAFNAGRTDRVVLLRQKSSWLDGAGLAKIMGVLKASLRPVAQDRCIILSMDACPVHTTKAVTAAVARAGCHYHLLPALATRWLQPCDVAVFAPLKHRIRVLMEGQQLGRRDAELPIGALLGVLADAVAGVVSGRAWRNAFALCGLHGAWPTSQRFLAELGPAPEDGLEGGGLPSLAAFESIFPRGRMIPVDRLFPLVLGDPRALAVADADAPAGASVHAEPAHGSSSWVGRLRSSSRLAVPEREIAPPAAAAAAEEDSLALARRRFPSGRRLLPWRPPAPETPLS